MSKNIKSVITCDLDGKIETYSEGAAKIFGYTDNYIKVAVEASHSIINTIQNVRLRSLNGNYIVGELVN